MIKLLQIRGSKPSALIILDGVREKKVRLILHRTFHSIESCVVHLYSN